MVLWMMYRAGSMVLWMMYIQQVAWCCG